MLTELRKRLAFADLGGKSLSSMEYLTDGGRSADGAPEGGIYARCSTRSRCSIDARAGDAVTRRRPLRAGSRSRHATTCCRRTIRARDVLVIDFAGFEERVVQPRLGLAHRRARRCASAGSNLDRLRLRRRPALRGHQPRATPTVLPAAANQIELYGREFGDFVGALLEGAGSGSTGRARATAASKADSGLAVRAPGRAQHRRVRRARRHHRACGTRARASPPPGRTRCCSPTARPPAPGFKSIHFGSPNEYAFEYLMSGGDNSLHVVMGLRKPDARGELTLKSKPYAGKFFMSGAAAGRRVRVRSRGEARSRAVRTATCCRRSRPRSGSRTLGRSSPRAAQRRGAPIRVEGENITVRLDGELAALALRRGVRQADPGQGREGRPGAGRGAAGAGPDRRGVIATARRPPRRISRTEAHALLIVEAQKSIPTLNAVRRSFLSGRVPSLRAFGWATWSQ